MIVINEVSNPIKEQTIKHRGTRIVCGDESLCFEMKEDLLSTGEFDDFHFDVYMNCSGRWILEIQEKN